MLVFAGCTATSPTGPHPLGLGESLGFVVGMHGHYVVRFIHFLCEMNSGSYVSSASDVKRTRGTCVPTRSTLEDHGGRGGRDTSCVVLARQCASAPMPLEVCTHIPSCHMPQVEESRCCSLVRVHVLYQTTSGHAVSTAAHHHIRCLPLWAAHSDLPPLTTQSTIAGVLIEYSCVNGWFPLGPGSGPSPVL